MVESETEIGKKTDMKAGPVWVVAGALRDSEDKWLLHRRPFEKHHGGLWEFPGGKIEGAEIPAEAIIRELREELGIEVRMEHCEPIGFAEDRSRDAENPIVILLYMISRWNGEPRALEGEGIGWFSHDRVVELAKPPLDQMLLSQLPRK